MKAVPSILHILISASLTLVRLTAGAAIISGEVADVNDGAPLPFCVVRVTPGGLTAVSDMEGRFRMECPDGMYELSASYMGYEEGRLPVEAKGDLRVRLDLQPSVYTLDVVTVTAREEEGMTGGSKIDRAAMDHLQPSSFADLLELLPGNISKDPSLTEANTITLRETGTLGATGSPTTSDDYAISSLGTLFVVDGVPLNTDANLRSVGTLSDVTSPDYRRNTTNKGVDMRTITTDNIESVEVIRGIPSAEYGNLTSGMVNIRRIYRRTPLTARFKADGYSKLLSVGKGIAIPDYAHVLNVDAGYLDARSDPRSIRESYRRLNASARFNARWQRDMGEISWSVAGDYTSSFDNVKNDPDLSLRKIDEYSAVYSKGALSSEASWIPESPARLSRVSLSTALSLENDLLEQRKQVAPSRPSAAPSTMAPGISEGHFILSEYIADYRSEGRPLTFFMKGDLSGELSRDIVSCSYKAGAEWTIAKNLGRGQVYDLMKPLSASWTSRPRDFREIPAYHTLGVYLQSQLTLRLGRAGRLSTQTGVRMQMLPRLDSRYDLSGKPFLDPRVNILWHPSPDGRFRPFLGGGFGMTTRMPTVDYLYPQAKYTDLVELSYYDISQPSENSLLLLRTYVDEAVNYSLKAARNRKWELRAGFSFRGNSLTITWFDERMRSGFRYSYVYAPYTYTLYDTSGVTLDSSAGPPSIDALPSQQVCVLRGYRQPTNGTRIDKRGIEFQFSSARWDALKTALTVSGAWLETRYSNSEMLYSPVSDVVGDVAVSDRYVGVYDYYDGRRNSQINTNFMLDTQIPRWGLVFTATLQCMWNVRTVQLPKNGIPSMYMSADDGLLHPFTQASMDDPMLMMLVKQYNENVFRPVSIPIAMYLNLKAGKSIGKALKISLFVNRILDWLPDYTVNGLTVRRDTDAYFGMEINLSLSI